MRLTGVDASGDRKRKGSIAGRDRDNLGLVVAGLTQVNTGSTYPVLLICRGTSGYQPSATTETSLMKFPLKGFPTGMLQNPGHMLFSSG